jgi:hypothetical protein
MSIFAVKFFSATHHGLARLLALLSPRDDEPPTSKLSRDDIAQLYPVAGESARALDDQTWADLLLDRYADSLSAEVSLFGRQVLYRRLRIGSDVIACAPQRDRLHLLMADPAALAGLHRELRSLRHADTDVAALLFEQEKPQAPRWVWWTLLLPLALLASLAAVALSPLAWFGVGLVLYLLLAIQMRYHAQIQQWAADAFAVPLSIGLEGKGAFISGQNGVGKSAFLRTVGLNLVAARAFGFCYARQARLPALPVYASMQNEDSLLGGESLYVAELRRAKEPLAAAHGPRACVYLIDEIFRGTNHVESVSAAAAVLDVLAERGLVIVSSHNLVLVPLLAHRLDLRRLVNSPAAAACPSRSLHGSRP